MNGGRARRDRRWARRLTALCLGSVATGAWAQVQPEPLPPQEPTTTIEEAPSPEVDGNAPVAEPSAEPKIKEPERSPPNAGGIPLSTLETRNQSLLYFDPVQTYLTPYVARSFENAIE